MSKLSKHDRIIRDTFEPKKPKQSASPKMKTQVMKQGMKMGKAAGWGGSGSTDRGC